MENPVSDKAFTPTHHKGEGFYEYFNYVSHPFEPPPELLGGKELVHPVCIVGGGPVGLAVALDLARFGVRSVVMQQSDTLNYGSRAGCLSRRSLEIFDRLGVVDAFMRTGLPWVTGYCYYRDKEVLRFDMPAGANEKFPPMLNIPQNFVEQYLLDAANESELIEIRWQQKVVAVKAESGGATVLTVETARGPYELQADWVLATDGARSTVRKSLGLQLQGETFEGRYLIADIRFETNRQVGRLAWFDPPSNPGSTILMHKMTDEIWRFDYQLSPDVSDEEAVDPAGVSALIARHLAMMGETGKWELSWISIYRANALSLEHYRHGNVLFLGDAAHPIPIFGVRGLNSGLDDAHNLAWKLACVMQGVADESLLDTYSIERVAATAENLRNAKKSTVFMCPPSPAYCLMREAALSLAVRDRWLSSLINPRQSAPVRYESSPISSPEDESMFEGGPAVGEPMRQAPIRAGRGRQIDFLAQAVSKQFLVLCFSRQSRLPGKLASRLDQLIKDGVPLQYCVVAEDAPEGADWWLEDVDGKCATAYGVREEALYLIRPDGYVAGRWDGCAVEEIETVMRRIFCVEAQHEI